MNTINNAQLHNQNRELQPLFKDFLSECEYSKRLRPATIKGYSDVFKNFSKQMPEILILRDLSPMLISEFFKRLALRMRKDKREIKNSTLRTYYNKLIVFFKWLERLGYIEKENLTTKIVKPPTPTYEDDRALNEAEVSKIISSITLHSFQNTFLYKRDILIVSTLLYTGIRKGELLGLRVQDIDFNMRTLFINGATSKSKKSRKIPLHPTLIMHLKVYLKERRTRNTSCPYLLLSSNSDTKFTGHGLKHWVEKYKRLSCVNFHIHRFRHTFACTLAKNNADIVSIKSVMGHSSIKMTERYLRSIGSENARGFIDSLSF